MTVRALVCVAVGAAMFLVSPAGAVANQGFVGVTSDQKLATFTEQTQGGFTALRAITGRVDGSPVVAVDGRPDGKLIALDASGRLFDLSAATGRLKPLLGGRAVAPPVKANGPVTFSVTNTEALVVSGDAHRIDLTTGASAPVAPFVYAPGQFASGALPSPVLDSLPGGLLEGVDGNSFVVRQTAAGGPFSTLSRLVAYKGRADRLPVRGASRLAVTPDGTQQWLLTQMNPRAGGTKCSLSETSPRTTCSRVLQVDPKTGAPVAQAPFNLVALVALAATGPTPLITGKPKVQADIPRTVSYAQIQRGRGLTITFRSDQVGGTTGSLHDRQNHLRGFGSTVSFLAGSTTTLRIASNQTDWKHLRPKFRVLLRVHGGFGHKQTVTVIDRWIHVSG